MLVVMAQSATQQEIDRVIETIEEMGYEARPMPGAQRTTVGLVVADEADGRALRARHRSRLVPHLLDGLDDAIDLLLRRALGHHYEHVSVSKRGSPAIMRDDRRTAVLRRHDRGDVNRFDRRVQMREHELLRLCEMRDLAALFRREMLDDRHRLRQRTLEHEQITTALPPRERGIEPRVPGVDETVRTLGDGICNALGRMRNLCAVESRPAEIEGGARCQLDNPNRKARSG